MSRSSRRRSRRRRCRPGETRARSSARCRRTWPTITTSAGYACTASTHRLGALGIGEGATADEAPPPRGPRARQGKPQREIPIAYKESERLTYRKYGDALGYCQNILPQSEIHRSDYEDEQ